MTPFSPSRVHHQKSRYVYELYYKRKAISKGIRMPCVLRMYVITFYLNAELYEFCLKEGYADANLIAKWKKVWKTTH